MDYVALQLTLPLRLPQKVMHSWLEDVLDHAVHMPSSWGSRQPSAHASYPSEVHVLICYGA